MTLRRYLARILLSIALWLDPRPWRSAPKRIAVFAADELPTRKEGR
jgi:hypothetical protein